MLSFKFQLTSAQLKVLLDIYAGGCHPSSKVTDDNTILNGYSYSSFVAVCARLQERGLVVHVTRPAKRGESLYGMTDGMVRGHVCTQKGRMIAQMAIESAQRMLALAKIAEQRGLDVSSREEGVA